jgi:hypothetical protein
MRLLIGCHYHSRQRENDMILKMGKLILSHEKSYMSTVDEVPERFPVKIRFTRKLTDEEMTRLGIYALMIENGIDVIHADMGTTSADRAKEK